VGVPADAGARGEADDRLCRADRHGSVRPFCRCIPTAIRSIATRRFLHGLIAHLDAPKVYLLGHSHGGLVAQRYALTYPGRLAGMILYSSAPTGGPELFAEATRNIEAFARRHEGRPEAADILKTWASIGGIADDASFTAVMRQLLPAYFADYWAGESEFASLRTDMQAFHVISGPAPFDDRTTTFASITTPTLVSTGRHDFICGLRWAQACSRASRARN